METQSIYFSGECPPAGAIIQSIADYCDTSTDEVVASCIKWSIEQEDELGRLMQYASDIMGDQFVSEEFYNRHPRLLDFLDKCGCDNEEVRFRAYVNSHRDIFQCKSPDCDGTIVGGCPRMACDTCGKKYFVNIDKITDLMCSRCVANKRKECTELMRRLDHQIFAS